MLNIDLSVCPTQGLPAQFDVFMVRQGAYNRLERLKDALLG
jgi:hypothetical protein